MATIGSILYTVRSISNGMVSGWSYFEINSSMMKKLYTAKKHREENQVSSSLINGDDYVDDLKKVR